VPVANPHYRFSICPCRGLRPAAACGSAGRFAWLSEHAAELVERGMAHALTPPDCQTGVTRRSRLAGPDRAAGGIMTAPMPSMLFPPLPHGTWRLKHLFLATTTSWQRVHTRPLVERKLEAAAGLSASLCPNPASVVAGSIPCGESGLLACEGADWLEFSVERCGAHPRWTHALPRHLLAGLCALGGEALVGWYWRCTRPGLIGQVAWPSMRMNTSLGLPFLALTRDHDRFRHRWLGDRPIDEHAGPHGNGWSGLSGAVQPGLRRTAPGHIHPGCAFSTRFRHFRHSLQPSELVHQFHRSRMQTRLST